MDTEEVKMRTSDFSEEEFPLTDTWHHYSGFGDVHDSERGKFEEEYAECSECGDWGPRDDMRTTHKGDWICDSCYEAKYGTCEETGDVYLEDELERVNYPLRSGRYTTRYVCTRVAERDYTCCTDSEYWPNDAVHRRFDGDYMSPVEFDDCGYTCDSCGNVMTDREVQHDDEDDDVSTYCPNCAGERANRVIHDHDYSKYPSRRGRGPIYFGIEIEVEVPSGGRTEHAEAVRDRIGDYVVLKHDGSLSNGFEIVSGPMDLKYHRDLWYGTAWDRARKGLVGDTSSCGIHVHVSREPLSDLQIGRILKFVNDPAHSAQLRRHARRPPNSYCDYIPKKLTDAKKYASTRYQAVNTQNNDTIEFRIFRSNTRPDRIMQSLEFVAAVVAFCAPATVGLRNLAWPDFTRFVSEARKEYPALFQLLVHFGDVASPRGRGVHPNAAKPSTIYTE